MYLRTKCDRELYLSLFSSNEAALKSAGIPIPLKSRPGVQLITQSGIEFEYAQFDILIARLPNNVIHNKNGRGNVDLVTALKVAQPQTLILQPQIEPEDFRDTAFANLGVADNAKSFIPRLKGLRPDVLYVAEPGSAEYEILPDGSRLRVDPQDWRLPISVIDLKNITEANASYSAEVCLYAFFLANWLQEQDTAISSKFFVCDLVYLWRHVEMPRFNKIMSTKDGGDHSKRIVALLDDLGDGLVNYLVYMPSVRKFFVEDVPRVVRRGDEMGWQAVEYHVNPRCGSCDWLGNKSWLSVTDLPIFTASPNNYCFQNAEASDHLSKMPTLSKGAARVLDFGGHKKVADLVGMASDASSLKKHALLKRDRNQIGARAGALVNNSVTVDQVSKVGVLARSWNAEYDVVVNFDAGSGLLTGIAIRGILSAPYGKSFDAAGQPQKSLDFLGEAAFVVPQDNATAEWSAVLAFLDQLAEWIEKADQIFASKGWGKVHTQVCLWEPRQYEELCNAFGRQLLRILDLSGKTQRALAWVFPAEKLMEREDEICPSIVVIRDVINSSVLLPQRFATTLFGTAEHYHHPKLEPRNVDKYYVEPLGNAIPRERIFDIWKSPTGTVRIFGKDVSIAEAIQRYGSVLKAQTFALGSITARLRNDLKGVLEGSAPALSTSIPGGMNGVAHDSKLWNQWSQVSTAADETNAQLALITRPEWLEASYKAIVLESLIGSNGNNTYTFKVSEESTEAKIEEGDSFCTIGIAGRPGFPLQTAKSLGLNVDESTTGYWSRMYSVIAVKLEVFDRAARTAVVSFRARSSWVQDVFDAVIAEDVIPIGKEPIYIMDGMPYDDSRITKDLLAAIGNPKCAKTAPEALEAMGKSAAKKIAAGTDDDTPVARVLWAADKLSVAPVRTTAEATTLAIFAKTANSHELNSSQFAAVESFAASQLSIVWGPPGTGKTDTLAAFLHGVVREQKQRKILLTGPNYRTVEELAGRLAANLKNDSNAICDFCWVYSKNRDPKEVAPIGVHVDLRSFKLTPGSSDVLAMVQGAQDASRTTIIATTAHIVNQIVEQIGTTGDKIDGVFDLIVLDESSQIPVTLALRPLCALREDGQLVIAGDHLQMPPIHSLEPPVGAEHLVSSIQTYLIKRFQVPRQELLINYRSNQDLVEYAKTLGYPPKLSAFSAKKDVYQLQPLDEVIATLPSGIPITDAYKTLLDPVKRVATLIHDDPTSSQANDVEAGLVAGLAYCARHAMAKELDVGDGQPKTPFDDDTFFDFGIGIVTPHKAQKALVVRALLTLFPNANSQKVYDAVDTVERFQGGERQMIIVSFGVGDTDIIEGEEAFLLQMERTNVAVSRAMAKCIVLMPKSLAYHLPGDKKAAEASVAIKSYVEEFCRNRASSTIEFDGTIRDADVRWH
ncbi:AAA domain-containing protein [Mesorhizobium sp. M0051]|uniref:DEAD/DEAH box helicase n=1 Tax=Mesorhizobium sp. M0051 TaxID=2956862 RepID=UPI00333614FD